MHEEKLARLKSLEENLCKITAHTELLNKFSEMYSKNGNGTIRFDLSEGGGFSMGLLKTQDVAVAVTTLQPATYFDEHIHDEIEHIILFDGDFTMFKDNYVEVNLKIGEGIQLYPGEKHAGKTKNGCRFIAITIPANKDFPDEAKLR